MLKVAGNAAFGMQRQHWRWSMSCNVFAKAWFSKVPSSRSSCLSFSFTIFRSPKKPTLAIRWRHLFCQTKLIKFAPRDIFSWTYGHPLQTFALRQIAWHHFLSYAGVEQRAEALPRQNSAAQRFALQTPRRHSRLPPPDVNSYLQNLHQAGDRLSIYYLQFLTTTCGRATQ